MFGRKIHLFKMFGFQVSIDVSWTVIAVLIVWSLSAGYFPYLYEDLPTRAYWIMGIIGAIGLFVSIIVHEFSHSLVARQFGMPMKGITLFIFGGIAEMGDEPPNPRAEFWMAIVGPLSSFAIAALFYGVSKLGDRAGWPVPATGIIGYLATINLILALFNMVPAFPLDGGRVLRSILWRVKNNLRWATRISSKIGSGFGIALIILGVLNVLRGNFVGGMWWFLIGLFVQNAAKMSYQQLQTRHALQGEPVKRFMETEVITVPPSITVQQLVDEYVYKHHFKMFPVVEDGNRLAGCISTRQVKDIPREEWERRTVNEIATTCTEENTIRPEDDAIKALSMMSRNQSSRLMVVDNGRLNGIIALKDLLDFLSLKVDLEG